MKHLKDTLIQETSTMDKNKLMDNVDKMKDIIGADELLDALCRAMSSDELEDNLRYIDRMHETNVF